MVSLFEKLDKGRPPPTEEANKPQPRGADPKAHLKTLLTDVWRTGLHRQPSSKNEVRRTDSPESNSGASENK